MGLAVCDPDRRLVSPVEVYQVKSQEKDAAYFNELARAERIRGIVVGLPIHCDGGESQKSREARAFASWLHDTTGIAVRLFDERFSTAQAKERLRDGQRLSRQKVKRKLDAVAAMVLLESFLESQRYHGHVPGEPIDREDAAGEIGDRSLED